MAVGGALLQDAFAGRGCGRPRTRADRRRARQAGAFREARRQDLHRQRLEPLGSETEESIERRENDQEARRLFPEPGSTIKGRPTKRDRRAITRAGG